MTKQEVAAAVPVLPDPRPRHLHPAPLAAPEAGQDLHRRRRHGRAGNARRPLRKSRKRKKTRPGTCPNSAWAGDLAGPDDPAGARRPDQGPLDGDLRRRRHPRHRRDRIAGHAPPRTAASGWRSPTWKNCTTKSKSERRSTSVGSMCAGRRPARRESTFRELGQGALADYDRDLRARGSAERTRRAYGVDLGGFAEWAGEQGLGPGDVRHRDVRRYAAGLSYAGAAPATVARKLAAIRGLYGFLVRTERVGAATRPSSSPARSARRSCRRCSPPSRCARCWSGSRRGTPLELRDRAMLELAYSCGLRCEEIVNLDVGALDFETEQLRVLGKGSKERLLPVGEPAQRALRRYLRARPPRARRRSARAGALPLQERPPPLQLRRHPPPRPLDPRGGARRRASRRTHFDIPSQRICSRAAPICVRSRSCSATPRSRPPRSTPESTPPACATPTPPATPAHEPKSPQRT